VRIVVWNCNMALHRKFDALRALEPDVAVVCECASPERLRLPSLQDEPIWVGTNPHKGLAVFTFNGYSARLAEPFYPRLKFIAPVHISGPTECNLLAVWAQNASAGVTRKYQLGPLRWALSKYRGFLTSAPAVIAGDLNDNVIWDKPGWRHNWASKLAIMHRLGLRSAYHAVRNELPGAETVPTLYWRDRRRDGPTYHIDYVFVPATWLPNVTDLSIGTFEDWCASGLSDHVPIVVDIAV
jgi:exodeoxyribonuclease III